MAGPDKASEAKAAVSCLQEWLVSAEHVSAWPGTVQLGDPAMFPDAIRELFKFTITPTSMDMLMERTVPRMFQESPGAVEDLGFLRADGRPWVVTITHEKDAYLKLESDEIDAVTREIGSRRLRLRGDDEMPDERY